MNRGESRKGRVKIGELLKGYDEYLERWPTSIRRDNPKRDTPVATDGTIDFEYRDTLIDTLTEQYINLNIKKCKKKKWKRYDEYTVSK